MNVIREMTVFWSKFDPTVYHKILIPYSFINNLKHHNHKKYIKHYLYLNRN